MDGPARAPDISLGSLGSLKVLPVLTCGGPGAGRRWLLTCSQLFAVVLRRIWHTSGTSDYSGLRAWAGD